MGEAIVLKILSISLFFGAIILLTYSLMFLIVEILRKIQFRKVEKAEKKLDSLFIVVKREKLILFYTLVPFILGFLGYLVFNNLIAVIGGMGLGFWLPTILIHKLEANRKARFRNQLVDALLIISSSLKSGLSLIQAIEVLVEEMPAPVSEEFGLVLRENKMGVPLEDSLLHLYQRMKVEELELIITSILVARETGGDLTKVFSRLSNTIRDNRKLEDSIRTLTLQGRLQGIIMSILPFGFIAMILSFNPRHFDIMFQSDLGRMLLFVALILQIVGIILIRAFSKARV